MTQRSQIHDNVSLACGASVYLEYWGLNERPFENSPDPRFFYASQMHSEALDRILYAVANNKGCTLLTGDYGCGKTALIRKVIKSLSDPTDVALINYPVFSVDEFLQEILFQYGQETPEGSKLQTFRRLSTFCFENAQNGTQTLLVIDEAQLIEDPKIYEHFRLLLNLQLEDRGLMTLVLVGQPELREKVMEHPQLDQRIAVKCHLHDFNRDDTISYIRHRLRVAGATKEIFTPEALSLIFKITQGIPRRINTICDLSLFDGSKFGAKKIDEFIVKQTN